MGAEINPKSLRSSASSTAASTTSVRINSPAATIPIPEENDNSHDQSLYGKLQTGKPKSPADLVNLINGWLNDFAVGSKIGVSTAGLIDPILINFVNKHYSRTSDKKTLPAPGEKLTPLSTDESVSTLKEQKNFLEREFALAAALDGLKDEEVEEFVRDFLGLKDNESPGNSARGTATKDVDKLADSEFGERDPIMLKKKLDGFDAQITEFKQAILLLDNSIATSSRHAETEVDESESDNPASKGITVIALARRVAELDQARQALVRQRQEVVDYLNLHPESDATTTPARNPG